LQQGFRSALSCGLSKPYVPENQSEPISDNRFPFCLDIWWQLAPIATTSLGQLFPVIYKCLYPDQWPESLEIMAVRQPFKVLPKLHDIAQRRWNDVDLNLFIDNGDSIFIFIGVHIIGISEG